MRGIQLKYESLPVKDSCLNHYVQSIFNVSGFSKPEEGFRYKDKALPNGCTGIVFHFGQIMEVSNVDYDGKKIPRFYVLGPYTKPIEIEHNKGKIDVFTVIFKPLAFYKIFGIPVSKFKNTLVDLTSWKWRLEMDELIDQLWDFDFLNRKKVFEAYLLGKLGKFQPTDNFEIASRTIGIINQQKGVIGKIENFLPKLNFDKSERQIRRILLKYNGTTIKEYADAIRSTSTLAFLEKLKSIDLKKIVDEFDYYDESHLRRVFKKFTRDNILKFDLKEFNVARLMINQTSFY